VTAPAVQLPFSGKPKPLAAKRGIDVCAGEQFQNVLKHLSRVLSRRTGSVKWRWTETGKHLACTAALPRHFPHKGATLEPRYRFSVPPRVKNDMVGFILN
jgi:hypothetical protein